MLFKQSLTRKLHLLRAALPLVRRIVEDPRKLPRAFRKAVSLLRQGGIRALAGKVESQSGRGYQDWVNLYGTLGDDDRAAIRARIREMAHQPRISVLMPVFNPPEPFLRAAIESVMGQLYPNWELCIADDASTQSWVRPLLEGYAARDSRIKVVFRETNGHISAASNSALERVTGKFTALLDHDDELTEHALYLVAEEICAHPDADLIYSDEDKRDERGRLCDPNFKPDWNPDLFHSQNYLNHLTVYRTERMREAGGFREGFEGSQDYDLALRVIESISPDKIRHIPHVLYHWRILEGSVAKGVAQKDYASERARRALQEHFDRVGVSASVVSGIGPWHRVKYKLPANPPKVSLIVGTRDRLPLIRGMVESVLFKTRYPNYELLVMDNQSSEPATLEYFRSLENHPRVRVVKYDHPFNFSAMNNWGVKRTDGELIGLLNNDLLVISEDWLDEMVGHALRPEIGVVGAKLYYPNETIQHAGVILGIGGIAGHSHKYLPRNEFGFVGRAVTTQALSAVTAACIVMRREIFDRAGGLNETDLAVAYNDVDFCLRVRELGYRNLFTPFAELYHLESATRGSDTKPENQIRESKEAAYMKTRWDGELETDPYYSPNLSLIREDFFFAFPPRVQSPWRVGK